MGKFLIACLAFWAGGACAELLYVQTAKGHQCVGDRFRINTPMEVLYQDRRCELPIVHAGDMRGYIFRAGGTAMRGCWGQSLGGDYIIVLPDGQVRNSPSNAYVTARTVTDIDAVVTFSPNQGTAYAMAMEMCR